MSNINDIRAKFGLPPLSDSLSQGGVVSGATAWSGGDNPDRKEYCIPTDKLDAIFGHQDPEKWKPFPFSDKRSVARMAARIKYLEKERWQYFVIGATVGIVLMFLLAIIVFNR